MLLLVLQVLTTSSLRQITKSSTFSFVVPQTGKKEKTCYTETNLQSLSKLKYFLKFVQHQIYNNNNSYTLKCLWNPFLNSNRDNRVPKLKKIEAKLILKA